MVYQKALTQVKEFIQTYFADNLNPNRIYHNQQHVLNVGDWAKEIADHYKLDAKSLFIIQTSALFTNVCFYENPNQYQKLSARLAEKCLRDLSVPEELIKNIKNGIMSTRLPQSPKNLMEQIICDADMYHAGLRDFALRSKLMRKELESITGKKPSKQEWKQRNKELLQNHRYKTDYARQLLEKQQKQNLDDLLRSEDQPRNSQNIIASSAFIARKSDDGPQEGNDPKSPKLLNGNPGNSTEVTMSEKNKRPDRGIETMFRISSNNHQALSEMADSKAHIMITVNSIIISVLLSVLFRSLDNEPHLAIPVAILLMVNVITIIFSILATRPNIPSGQFTREDLSRKKVNLLFFGNYHRMKLEDFSEGMTQLMGDRDFLYGSLIQNLHSQGIVLGKKYRLLRISYNTFMYGLVISILAFGIAILLKQL